MLNEQVKERKNQEKPTILYYFSGTGNSLNVALKIQATIQNCTLISIPEAIKSGDLEITALKVGFIFPVYFLDIPHIVREFLNKIKLKGNPFIFAIATCGGEVGMTFKSIHKILRKQNKSLHSEYKMIFPSNSIVMFDKSGPPEEIKKRLSDSKIRLEEIIWSIDRNESVNYSAKGASLKNQMISLSGKLFLQKILNDRGFKIDGDLCKGCGICVAVCPMDNIELIDGIPSWNRNCECCAACLHWCPQNAIENIKTKGRPRYHHPEITVKMIKIH